MPTYWEGSTVVGSSGGTDTSGNPINPVGVVGGVDYGSGSNQSTAQTEQMQAQRRAFESPTAQWASESKRNELYRQYLRSGGTPIPTLGGVVPTSTMEQRQAEVKQIEAIQRQDNVGGEQAVKILYGQQQSAGPTSPSFPGTFGGPQPFQSDLAGRARTQAIAQEQANMEREHALNVLRQKAEGRVVPDKLWSMGLYHPVANATQQFQEKVIDPALGYSENASINTKILRGFYTGLASFPAMAATGLVGIETAARDLPRAISDIPDVVKATGEGMYREATQRPFEFAGSMAAMYVGARALEVGGRTIVNIAKEVPKPSIKFTETSEPAAVPGVGIVLEKTITPKITLEKPPTPKPIPTETEMFPRQQISKSTSDPWLGETKFEASLKEKPIPSGTQFYDLKKNQIETAMMVEKETGKPYAFVRGVELMRALEKSKLPVTIKPEYIPKETRGGTIGLWETKFEAASNKPDVKLMSVEERAAVIAKIKQSGGLYPTETQYAVTTPALAAAQRARVRQNAINLQNPLYIGGTKQIVSQQQKAMQEAGFVSITRSNTVNDALTIQSPISIAKSISSTTATPITTPIPANPLTVKTPETTRPPDNPPFIETPGTPTNRIKLFKKTEEDEDKKYSLDLKKKKGKEIIKGKGKTEFWYPASLENVTMEELSTGKRAVHIGRSEKKVTGQLARNLILTGRGIPTKKQFTSESKGKRKLKASDLL